jgi:hypothetical protein
MKSKLSFRDIVFITLVSLVIWIPWVWVICGITFYVLWRNERLIRG